MRVTENQLDEWVRGHAESAQGLVVELVWRLVAASSPNPKERRFPLGDSIGQPGPDGILDTDFSDEPFVPEGLSFWEIGTGIKPANKATRDYAGLTTNATTGQSPEITKQSTFIFVTPLSGRRGWNQPDQQKWLDIRSKQNQWKSIRIVDGTRLVDWMHHFPSVELWLAAQMGLPIHQIDTPELRWGVLRTIGDPPPLTPQVFLTNRDAASAKLKEVFSRNATRLKLDTRYPDQVADFVCAYIASMDDEARIDVIGRCLVVSGVEAWNSICSQDKRHILIADHELDLSGVAGTKLLEKAHRAGHAVVFGGMPGGIPDPNREEMSNPKSFQIKEALEKAGYPEERARILAQKSNGNLSSLLRCLQNLSHMPEWAEGTHASELTIALVLGSWSENSDADRAIAEDVSGKAYGEWIGIIREIACGPGTPLIQRDGAWKVVTRYEGWYTLGSKLFDELLNRLKKAALIVLCERDPKFELPADEHYTASLHGKVLTHSQLLRRGLAESLALLGSHPKALTSCSSGMAERIAVLTVREVLSGADWVLWASLNNLLPLLAEAAPNEFLNSVEQALKSNPCPFDMVFAQEGDGITGGNYTSGLLWAMETLAWDAAYLSRVVVLLGELAARDPGGKWANRPANSLTTILLPWMPQTCAPVPKRKVAVEILTKELPQVAWKLLLTLFPQSHQVTSGSHKPEWRELIADDWSKNVTANEFWEQTLSYVGLAIDLAGNDPSKLAGLIEHLDHIPNPALELLLSRLNSDEVTSLPESDRLPLWIELVDLVTEHKKYAHANWAMQPAQVDRIVAIAERLKPDAPEIRHRRLFSERDFELFEENESWEKQSKALDERRRKALGEVFGSGGVKAVLNFAQAVESSWRVGGAFGVIAKADADDVILPELLGTEHKSLAQFGGGFVLGRFHTKGWEWVENIDTSHWTADQVGQFLAYLPFTTRTWERSAKLLGDNESPYWTRANANAYGEGNGIEFAADRLVAYGRPLAAIRCLDAIRFKKQPLRSEQITRILLADIDPSEDRHAMDIHAIVELVKLLQSDPKTNLDELFKIEWAYLPLLERHRGVYPKYLEKCLATRPEFFSELIRNIFRSKISETSTEEPTEERKNIASNAYRLLSEWQTPPGSGEDGVFNGDAFTVWLEAVKKECSESGHLEVAMSMAAHVLIHVPPDPDGLWIHRSVAAALNAKDAEELRDGFQIELKNSRGMHWVDPSGKPELELADKYRAQAEAVEDAGYQRFAASLRNLAQSYEREAERVSTRDRFDG